MAAEQADRACTTTTASRSTARPRCPIRSTRSSASSRPAGTRSGSTARIQKAIAAAIARAQKCRQADADRLQDHDRLRRAEQGRHQQGAWRAARRRRRSKARARTARHRAAQPFEVPDDVLKRLARGRRARRGRAQGRGTSASPRSVRRKRAEFERRLRRRAAGGAGKAHARLQEEAGGEPPQHRDPQGLARPRSTVDRGGDAGTGSPARPT